MLKAITEEKIGTAFHKFCGEVMHHIYRCFAHFSTVMPQLANVRAHRDFHQARLLSIPAVWRSFTSAAGLRFFEPLHLQAVNRQLFDNCMKKFFDMLKPSAAQSRVEEVKLLVDKENAVRYACGYVGMKLLKEFRNVNRLKAAQFRECLSQMSKNGDDSSFYAYTTQ